MSRRNAVLRRVAANQSLRRVELAFLGFSCAENGVWVSVLVYAYEQGGTSLAALIAVVQLLPAAAVAPLASTLADRRGGAFGLWVGYIAQGIAIAATAGLLLLHAPALPAYFAAGLAACAVTFTRPAHAALLPLLVSDPRELTAANVVTGWFDSSSFLAGPAAAGVLIGIDGPGLACALFAAVAAASAVMVAPLVSRPAADASTSPADEVEDGGARAVVKALRGQPGATTLLGLVALQYVGLGALDVLVVVLAIKVLALGASAAGYLNAAFGAGGVLGGILAIRLIGRARLVPALILGGLAWSASFLILGAWPTTVGAFALLALGGASRTVLDVSGRTLLQRAVPDRVRGRVFGVLEGMSMLGFAVGSASVPLFALAGGSRTSVAATGVILAVAVAAGASTVAALERRIPAAGRELALLRESSIFGVLAAPELEELARALVPEQASVGEVVVREGEAGDRYYLVDTGRLVVTVGGHEAGVLGPGDGFGEIALLHGGIRAATVTALEPATLYGLERDVFIDAVTGSGQAHRAVERLIAERMDPRGDATPAFPGR